MRVIAGTAKGTRLYGARGYSVRPVIDRVKESLFGLLPDDLVGTMVLDLFAGVGSLGIEALSRGANHADFIEKHRKTADSIRSNLKRTHLEERAKVSTSTLPGGLDLAGGNYGLIFIDPPFRIEKRLLEDLFQRIKTGGLLERGGLVVYRYSPRGGFVPHADEWEWVDRRDYGDSIISIYRLID